MIRYLLLALLLLPLSALAETGFSFKDTTGKTQALKQYKGQWVLINFWATWCGPCIKEIPELVALQQARQGKDLQIISISVDSGNNKTVMDFARKMKMNFPVINWNWQQNAAMDAAIYQHFGKIEAIPTTLLYNPAGKLVAQQRGAIVTRADIEAYIRKKSQINPK